MGTRYEDQPPELWAGPESLDPTPVWKQFALIGIFLAVGLLLVGGVAVFAAAPQLVNPPAMVPGDRLVLPISALPPVVTGIGAPPTAIGPPLVDASQRFLLARAGQADAVAIRARWSPHPGDPECPVEYAIAGGALGYVASCERTVGRLFVFAADGSPRDQTYRGLDRYLVSVSGDRVIVNLSRVIEAPERTVAPVPTGIPQPQASP
jgi:hypothetical protein